MSVLEVVDFFAHGADSSVRLNLLSNSEPLTIKLFLHAEPPLFVPPASAGQCRAWLVCDRRAFQPSASPYVEVSAARTLQMIPAADFYFAWTWPANGLGIWTDGGLADPPLALPAVTSIRAFVEAAAGTTWALRNSQEIVLEMVKGNVTGTP